MTLQDSVDAWHDCAERVIALLRGLPDDAWPGPTDCPRWSVHDVAAHLAAVETELVRGGADHDPVGSGDGRTVSDAYTQRGVDARRNTQSGIIIDELEMAVQARHEQLRDLDVDPQDTPDRVPEGLDWSWQTLLSNRVIDMWVHEQDIRDATDVPGGMDSRAAEHTVAAFRSVLPYVLGKRVAPPAGTSVRWTVTGHNGFDVAARIGDDGRAQEVKPGDDAEVHLKLSEHAFTRLLAGRRSAEDVEHTRHGEPELAHRVLTAMNVVG